MSSKMTYDTNIIIHVCECSQCKTANDDIFCVTCDSSHIFEKLSYFDSFMLMK